MSPTATRPAPPVPARTAAREKRLRGLAIGTSAGIALIYALIFAGVLSIGSATAGDLGILGLAGAVFAIIAAALLRWHARSLLVGVALLQVALAAMYVAVAPERDPHFEVWGLSIRALSVALLFSVVGLLFAPQETHDGPRT